MTVRSIALFSLVSFLLSCSSSAIFEISKITPAAEGIVKVKELKNGNYSIHVEVSNLADPQNLKPSRDHYVIWNKSSDGKHNLGELVLTEQKSGMLDTETTFKPKKILISAEKDPKVTEPGKLVVLESKKL